MVVIWLVKDVTQIRQNRENVLKILLLFLRNIKTSYLVDHIIKERPVTIWHNYFEKRIAHFQTYTVPNIYAKILLL